LTSVTALAVCAGARPWPTASAASTRSRIGRAIRRPTISASNAPPISSVTPPAAASSNEPRSAASTVIAGTPMVTVQPVNGERLYAA